MDDGLRRGDEVFEKQMSKLEAKFPFESKKDTSVHIHWCSKALAKASQCLKASMLARLSQFIYIYMSANRQTCLTDSVTSEEKRNLRALIGSLQYAASNTRPDLSSRLSCLQSEINRVSAQQLQDANCVLREGKRYKNTQI